jgi:hypothetical protein
MGSTAIIPLIRGVAGFTMEAHWIGELTRADVVFEHITICRLDHTFTVVPMLKTIRMVQDKQGKNVHTHLSADLEPDIDKYPPVKGRQYDLDQDDVKDQMGMLECAGMQFAPLTPHCTCRLMHIHTTIHFNGGRSQQVRTVLEDDGNE